MINKRKHIKSIPLIDLSGYNPDAGNIPFPKKHEYFVVTDIAITGDAPKDFIRYYHFGEGRKNNLQKWPLYIAKLGHKHYPVESITEYLLNRIGQHFGFNMAHSELAWLGGQIRFLSKYFITDQNVQILDHGADLFAGYLNDRDFVEEIEKQKQAPDFFTVQFTLDTLKHHFPEDYEILWLDFIKLLFFDALIGNNDRHFYNWAVIRNIQGNVKPVFSPIYDTARGLFWNEHENKILDIFHNKNRLEPFIKKYCDNCKPKIGWEGVNNINHFQLLEYLKTLSLVINCNLIQNLCNPKTLESAFIMIDSEFNFLLSFERRELIKLCLQYRHSVLRKMFNFAV